MTEPISSSHEKKSDDVPYPDAIMSSQETYEMVALNNLPPEPAKVRSTFRVFAIMAALFSTLFLASLNQTIMATAIPTISSDLHSASGYAWIGGAYLLANATAAPIWAKLSDIWGRKPILMTVVAMYFVSSVVCALSNSMEMLIIGRAFQGTAGGGLIQLVYITISDLFSMRSRTLYLGLLQLMWTIAGGVGPVLGGVLTEYASWRWVFWINLPISSIAFLLLLIFLDVHNPNTKFVDGVKAIDWFGSFSILGLMVMLLLGLNFGGVILPWNSATVICLIVFGLLMSFFFVVSESRLARYPIMPLDLFRHKSNVACLVVGFMHDFALIATEYYLPLFFQSVKEASPSKSGVLILPITLTQAVMGVLVGIIIHRTGRYIEVLWVGITLFTLGTGLYIHLNPNSSIGEIVGFETVSGIGAGMLFSPPLVALQAMVSQAKTSTATATLGFVRNLATVLAVILGGVIFQNGMDRQTPALQEAGLPANITAMLSGNDAMANVMIIATIEDPAQKLAVKQAFALSLRNLWIMCSCMAGCGILASAFIIKKSLSKEHQETKTGLGNESVQQ